MTTLAIPKQGTGLWVQVLIAMAVGIALGVIDPELASKMQPFGDAFIKAIRMLIAPIIFCTVVHGMAHMADMARVGRIAVEAIVYFEVITTIALVIALIMVNLLRLGAGMNIDPAAINSSVVDPYVKQTAAVGFVRFLMNSIPGTLASITSTSADARWPNRIRAKPHATAKMIFAAVGILMWAAPIGAFGAIAFTVGKFGVGSLASLGKLLGEFYITCVIFVLIALGPVARLCGLSFIKLIRYIREELLICIATTSSEVVLPRLISKLEHLGCDRGVVGLVIPTGYSFNLDGTCLYLAMTTVFLAQATNIPPDLNQQIGLVLILLVTSKGAAGIAGAALVVLAAMLAATGSIPVASGALILGIHRLMSQALTPTNLIGNAMATIVVAKWENAVDQRWFATGLERRSFAAGHGVATFDAPRETPSSN
jgi:aerobic C4-dicarboxylate transport protein